MATRPKTKKSRKPGSSPNHARRLPLRSLLIIYAALVIVSGVLALLIVHRPHPAVLADPFSTTQRTAAGFQLYYPAQLPTGYRLDTSSFDTAVQNNILSYRILDSNGASIDITEQKPPAGFNFATFYKTLDDTLTFKTPLGTVTAGTIDSGKTHLANLVTRDTVWVLMRTARQLPEPDIKQIFMHLQPSK